MEDKGRAGVHLCVCVCVSVCLCVCVYIKLQVKDQLTILLPTSAHFQSLNTAWFLNYMIQ